MARVLLVSLTLLVGIALAGSGKLTVRDQENLAPEF